MDRFVVVKSLTRRYGYAIKAPWFITWARGPQHTVGWYRTKTAAQARAKELNAALQQRALSAI